MYLVNQGQKDQIKIMVFVKIWHEICAGLD